MDNIEQDIQPAKTWQDIEQLFELAAQSGQEAALLQLLLTQDERELLISRANIFYSLLKGDMSQRKISEQLGVGIATITRGSHALKTQDQKTKDWLMHLIKQLH
jgi:TrpR family trp operon transcriptional repressor